jgi:hypothetical protein
MKLAMALLLSVTVAASIWSAETPDGIPIKSRTLPDGRTVKAPSFTTLQTDQGLMYVVKNKSYTAEEFSKKFPIVAELISGDYARVNHEVGGSSIPDDDRQVDVYHYDGKKYEAAEFKKTFPHKYAVLKMLADKVVDGVVYEDSVVRAKEIPKTGVEDVDERGDAAIAIETNDGVRRYKVDGKEISEKEFKKRFPKTAEKLNKQ